MTDLVTIRGFVAKPPTTNTLPSGVAVTNFRVASTPRWYDYNQQMWREGTTNWYDVKTFRTLAENCGRCIFVGQPVIVTGRLSIRQWSTDGGKRGTSVEIDATAVGHDLNLGTSSYTKPEKNNAPAHGAQQSQSQPTAGQNYAQSFSAMGTTPDVADTAEEHRDVGGRVDPTTGEIQEVENHANAAASSTEGLSQSQSQEVTDSSGAHAAPF